MPDKPRVSIETIKEYIESDDPYDLFACWSFSETVLQVLNAYRDLKEAREELKELVLWIREDEGTLVNRSGIEDMANDAIKKYGWDDA